ncbi:MAG: hypothetical protein HY939_05595 [Gammaproteobacteria bacterium]|nr:hypothetical protein [Gammaproteobacteria bacterium]
MKKSWLLGCVLVGVLLPLVSFAVGEEDLMSGASSSTMVSSDNLGTGVGDSAAMNLADASDAMHTPSAGFDNSDITLSEDF